MLVRPNSAAKRLHWNRRLVLNGPLVQRTGEQERRIPPPVTRNGSHESVPLTRRHRLVSSSLGLVEDYWCRGANRQRAAEGHSPDFQIALPYQGLFVWHVGQDAVVGDSNQVLFIPGGEEFHLSEPVPGAYGELIVTPSLELLAEILRRSPSQWSSHPAFRRRRALAEPALLLWRARALYAGRSGDWTGLAGDEALVTVLRTALAADSSMGSANGATRRLIDRTKEYVAARLSSNLYLADVAKAVDASPAYLTDIFRKFEGLSLHRYVVQLRLARALVDLPHTNDITTLALTLGFSSHSHFTATFRATFGCTPSAFRAQPLDGALPWQGNASRTSAVDRASA